MNSNPYSRESLLADLFLPDEPLEGDVEAEVSEVENPPAPVVLAPENATQTPVVPVESVVIPDFRNEPGSRMSEGSNDEGAGTPLGQIVAVVNQKGGVGKTTSTINLGAALAEQGARVLLVDFDPQGALSVGLGLNPNEIEISVYNLLLERGVGLADVVVPTRVPGMDLIPANIDLSAAEVVLVSEVAREHVLEGCLKPAVDRYDYVLIDCPPSLGLLTVNALTAAHSVVIPLECEYFALRGMALLMDTVGKVQERLNPGLSVLGIVATMLEARTIHGREVLSRVGEAFGDKLFKTVIHKTIKFSEGSVAGVPILEYAPSSNGAQEYRDLAREVMARAS